HLGAAAPIGPSTADTSQRLSNCPDRTTDSLNMDSFLRLIRLNIKRYPADNWHHLWFTKADTATIKPVYDSVQCRHAFETITQFMAYSTIRPKAIRLARAGGYFIAQDAPPPGGHNEFESMFFLDVTLTRVIWPCAEGSVCPSPD